ncbi:MAG: class I SAM-dependent methyltransferase [Hyphomicrobiales bacterium]|nr:class I SAM-dependent methyltransferase [Hyphomicrobiales bacterium]
MLTTVKADLAVWEWETERYDVVIAIFIQFGTPMLRDRMFEGFYTALKLGGSLIMQGYRVEQLRHGTGSPPGAKQLYTSELPPSAFAHWDICYLKEHDSPVDEEAGHSGTSALIDLVARKPVASSGRVA